MTEEEWLRTTDPTKMLELLRGTASDRKSRLFSCACCRRIWHLIPAGRLRAAVQTAESYADNGPLASTLTNAHREAGRACEERLNRLTSVERRTAIAINPSPNAAAASAAQAAAGTTSQDAWATTSSHFFAAIAVTQTWQGSNLSPSELLAQTGLIRDIFGNLFRPMNADPAWLTSTVVALAEGIYQGKAFDRLPILADALQDAGCDNEAVLTHCRSDGPHVRGCWVIDLLTGQA